MKEVYLPADTKYLTNEGMKTIDDFTEETMIATIDRFGKMYFTKNFEIFSNEYKSMIINSDGKYNTLVSSCEVDFLNHYSCIDQREPKPVKFYLDEKIVDGATEDYVIALSIFVSTFFKKTATDDLIENKKPGYIFKVFSTYNSLFGVYFYHDNYAKTYRFKSKSLYAEPTELENTLIKYRDIFNSILEAMKNTKMIFGGSYKKVGFNSYRVANIFQVLLSLISYKTRLTFNNDKKLFEVIFTNQEFSHEFVKTKSDVHYKTPIRAYSIQISDFSGRIVVSQNIEHNTTISIVKLENS